MATVPSVGDIAQKIKEYAQLPASERPAFGQTILTSLNGAERYWVEAERTSFWSEYGVSVEKIKQAAPLDDVKERPIDWKAGVSWPAYFYVQVHPEDKGVDMVTRFSEGIQTRIGDVAAFCQSIFKMPPEHAQFRATLEMLENRLSGKKLVDFTAKQWEALFTEINASLGPNRGKMRTETSLVINTLKFYQCPKNPDSFKAIDQYFVQGQPKTELEAWKLIRTRVYNFVYKDGSKVFTSKEMEFLEKHDLFHRSLCPPPEELPQLMKNFCRELPDLMKKACDPFDLMAMIHQKMVHIHYFKDENGRTSRILMALIALQSGLQPVLLEGNREYYLAVADKDPGPLAALLRQWYQNQQVSLADARVPMIAFALKGIMQSSTYK
jgi:hypothetical protein